MRLIATATLCGCLSVPVAGQRPRARVEIDHATGNSHLIVLRGARADTSDLGKDPVVRLDRSIPVEVRVVNTNTALYTFSTKRENTPVPEIGTLQGFAGKLMPYLPVVRTALTRGRGVTEGTLSEAAIEAARVSMRNAESSTRSDLLAVDQALYGTNGLQPTLATTLLAIDDMRRGTAAEIAAEPLRTALEIDKPCGTSAPVHTATVQSLLGALTRLAGSARHLGVTMSDTGFEVDPQWRALRDTGDVLQQRAQTAMADFEPLVATGYRVERLAGIVSSACSTWNAGNARESMTNGTTMTIKVTPRTEPELERVADRGAETYTVVVEPRALVRPAAAFAGFMVPSARFPTYATHPVTGGVEVYESGRTDRRFGIGGSIGFTWPGLDQRESSGIAVWLPELVVAAGDMTGAGIGGGISASFMKLGLGAMWLRHTTIQGARVGDVIAKESLMKTVEGYGKPQLYISLSMFDWSPLTRYLPKDSDQPEKSDKTKPSKPSK